MHIRSIKKDDNQAIKELISMVMSKEFPDDQKAYQYNDLDDVYESYGDIREKFLVALEGDKIIGTAGIKEDSEKVALLRRLFVHPSHRGRGIGSMLVDTAIDFCKMSEYKRINFRATSKMKPAIELLCQKKGFAEKDRCPFNDIVIINLVYKIR